MSPFSSEDKRGSTMASDRPSVVLFVFNRPDKVERNLLALQNQTVRPSRLIVFSDGARDDANIPGVEATRRLVHSVSWAETHVVERERNLGCAQNITLGLSEVLGSYESAVVLEDDTLPAAHFYESMCILLSHYAAEERIFSVGGYPSIKRDALPGYPFDVIISPRFSCWGWGTWADRWKDIERALSNFSNPFGSWKRVPLHAGHDLRDGARILEERPLYSWAIPVALLCLHRELCHVHTRHYLITNTGNDRTGTHASSPRQVGFALKHNVIEEKLPRLFPVSVDLDADVCQSVQQYVDEILALGEPWWLKHLPPYVKLGLRRIRSMFLTGGRIRANNESLEDSS